MEKQLTKKWSETSTTLLDETTKAYQSMQRGWWIFAKHIYDVHKSKAFEVAGFDDFKSYATATFPTMNYSTLIKFITIVEYFGNSLEKKLDSLPAYETCYKVAVLKSEALKRQVLQAKVSYSDVREKVRESHGDETPIETPMEEREVIGGTDLISLMADQLCAKLKLLKIPPTKKLHRSLRELEEEIERVIGM